MPRSNILSSSFPSLDVRAAVWSGVIAGAVFLMMEMALVALTGGEVWGPPRMMAAIVMGPGVLPPPATFAPGIVTVALAVHFGLSILYAVVVGVLVHGRAMGVALAIGVVFGLAIYLINFYGVAAVAFPWFAMARNWVSVVSHLVFGGVVAGSYRLIAERWHQPA